MAEAFFDGFSTTIDGPFVVANFSVQLESLPLTPVQIRVTFRAWDSFESIIKQQDPAATEGVVRERLSAYLGSKLADKLDAGEPLESPLDFVASPTEAGTFHLDTLDLQMFLRRER